jgi:hypothetical protein
MSVQAGGDGGPGNPIAGAVVAAGQVAGALIGAVGIVYVLGGAIIWARMALAANAQITVVAGLSRETVTSAALGPVVFALLIGVVYAILRLVNGDEGWPRMPGTALLAGIFLAPTAATVVVSLIFNEHFRSHVRPGTVVFLLVVLIAAWPYALFARRAWGMVVARPLAARSAVVAAVVLPWLMLAAVSIPAPLTRVCTAGTTGVGTRHVDGTLIGETSERVYVTDTTASRIVSVPKAEVTRVYIGNDADATTSSCPTPKGSTPSSP